MRLPLRPLLRQLPLLPLHHFSHPELLPSAVVLQWRLPNHDLRERSRKSWNRDTTLFENGTHSPISPVDVCIFSALPKNRTRGELKPAGEARSAKDAPIPGETKSTRELRASKSAMKTEPTKSVKVKRNATFGACESKSFACHVTPPSRRLSLQSGEQPELGFENLAQRFRINMMSQRDSEDSFVTAHGDSMYFADESDLFGSNFRAANLFHRQKTKSTDDQDRRLIPRSPHLEPWSSAMHGGASVPTLVVTQESRGFDPGEKCKNRKLSVPVYVCLIIIAGYLFAGALLFATWEGWDWLTGYYFCFVTLSTVGFGDIVPGTELKDWASHEKLVLCALWLAFRFVLAGHVLQPDAGPGQGHMHQDRSEDWIAQAGSELMNLGSPWLRQFIASDYFIYYTRIISGSQTSTLSQAIPIKNYCLIFSEIGWFRPRD